MIGASRAVRRIQGSQRMMTDTLPRPKVARMIGLHMGDPSFDTPDYVKEAAVQAMREGYTHYPPPKGDEELREAIAGYQSRISGAAVSPSEVLPTPGGTGAIFLTMMALLDEGDEVILFDPMYSLYADVVKMVGATVVRAPLTSDFSVDLEAVRAAVSPRTRMMVLNYPSNPTGRLLRRGELDGLAAIACEHDLAVMADEVYDQLVFEGQHVSVLSHPDMVDRTILIHSFSKTYAMTGWRMGYVVAKPHYFGPIWEVSRRSTSHVNIIAQRAALAALTNEEEDRRWRAWMLAQYQAQRAAFQEEMARVPGVYVYPLEAAFYAWVRYDAPLSSIDLVKYVFERGLTIRPGSEFGALGEKHLRFTFAPSAEVISDGIAIFRACMEELRGH